MSKDEQANRIRELRVKAGLSQSALAAAAGTSQQQIARIERGAQNARLDLARRISEALGTPMERVFPQARLAIERMAKLDHRTVADQMLNGGPLSDQLGEAGIELDPRVWTLKLRLANGTEHFLSISAKERRLAHRAIQSEHEQFLLVDTLDARVIINLEHLEFAQFLFDPPRPTDGEPNDDRNMVVVYTAGSPIPLKFGVDVEDPPEEGEEDIGQIAHLFAMASMMTRGDAEYRFNFVDEDGEVVFLLARSVSMLSVPLWVLDPNALAAEDDLDPATVEE